MSRRFSKWILSRKGTVGVQASLYRCRTDEATYGEKSIEQQ